MKNTLHFDLNRLKTLEKMKAKRQSYGPNAMKPKKQLKTGRGVSQES